MRHFIAFSVVLTALFANADASAQETEDAAIDKAIACRDIAEPLERLACLDAAAETLAVTRIIREEEIATKAREEKENFGLAKKDAEPKETPAPTAQVAEITETPDEFGSEGIRKDRKERDKGKLKSIESKIAEIRINQFGKVTLTLENGQIWRQLSSDNKTVHFSKNDRLYTAKVKRSLMGNYMLTVNELKRTIRVRRVE